MTTATTRILTVLILIAGCLAVAMALRPHWLAEGKAESASSDFVLVSPPDERTVLLAKRMREKARIVQQLIANDLTLLDAAAAFRILNEQPAYLKEETWRNLPGRTDEERLCRQVISWVEGHLQRNNPTAKQDERVARLERELDTYIARHGTVDLGQGP